MILSDISIKRPVFASVISLLLIVFGLVSFSRLPLREYPDIDPPVVISSARLPDWGRARARIRHATASMRRAKRACRTNTPPDRPTALITPRLE